jgi:hypothetical protein
MSWVKRLSLLALAGVAGCYSFSGGGGLPSHIKTAYVEPAENQTTRFGISEVLTQQLLEAAQDRLGLMLAAEEQADAVIRVTVSRYSDQAVNFQAEEGVGANVFTRRITVTATVEILDIVNGEYQPDVQTEDEGTALALENLVQKIVDGAQSQW